MALSVCVCFIPFISGKSDVRVRLHLAGQRCPYCFETLCCHSRSFTSLASFSGSFTEDELDIRKPNPVVGVLVRSLSRERHATLGAVFKLDGTFTSSKNRQSMTTCA